MEIFFNQLKAERNSALVVIVEDIELVHSFDSAAKDVIVMPGNDLVLVGVGLFFDGVIDDDDTIVGLDLPNGWLD